MERLTEHGFGQCTLEATGGEWCKNVCYERNDCECCPIQEAIDLLAAYEDIGLTPEEIAAREEKIKKSFGVYIQQREDVLVGKNVGQDTKDKIVFTVCDIIELYGMIFDISYDEAAKELHGSGENENT